MCARKLTAPSAANAFTPPECTYQLVVLPDTLDQVCAAARCRSPCTESATSCPEKLAIPASVAQTDVPGVSSTTSGVAKASTGSVPSAGLLELEGFSASCPLTCAPCLPSFFGSNWFDSFSTDWPASNAASECAPAPCATCPSRSPSPAPPRSPASASAASICVDCAEPYEPARPVAENS